MTRHGIAVAVCLLVGAVAGLHCRSGKTQSQAAPAGTQRQSIAGQGPNSTRPRAGQPNAASRPSAAQPGPNATRSKQEALKLKTVVLNDEQGIGIEALRLLIPQDWQFEGNVKWVTDHPGMPATIWLRAGNPREVEEFELFPQQGFFWTNNRLTLSLEPPGSIYLGNEVRPPPTPLEALHDIILPRFRGGVSGLEIVSVQELPEISRTMTADFQSRAVPGEVTSADAAKVRIRYASDSQEIEEEIYCTVEQASFRNGTSVNTNWFLDHVYSFKAENGRLDDDAKLLAIVAQSVRLNPVWYSRYNQTVVYLCQQQMNLDNRWLEVSRAISQSSNNLSDMIMDVYNKRQASQDRIIQNFCDNILSIDRYHDPSSGEEVQLPSGYESAWVNGLGEYSLGGINYDPNIGSNQTWRQLRPPDRR